MLSPWPLESYFCLHRNQKVEKPQIVQVQFQLLPIILKIASSFVKWTRNQSNDKITDISVKFTQILSQDCVFLSVCKKHVRLARGSKLKGIPSL